MTAKRIIGTLVLIIGIASVIASLYITNRIEEGKEQISSAQKKVDKGSSLFSMNPVAKELGQGIITDPAQKKINEANQEVAQYEILAKRLKIGGIILAVLGLGILFVGKKK